MLHLLTVNCIFYFFSLSLSLSPSLLPSLPPPSCLPCFFPFFLLSKVCLVLLDWMLNVICRNTIRTAVSTIFDRNGHTFSSVRPLISDTDSIELSIYLGLSSLYLSLPFCLSPHTHTLTPHYLHTIRRLNIKTEIN